MWRFLMMLVGHKESSGFSCSRWPTEQENKLESAVCWSKTDHQAFVWASCSAQPAVSVNVPGSRAFATRRQQTSPASPPANGISPWALLVSTKLSCLKTQSLPVAFVASKRFVLNFDGLMNSQVFPRGLFVLWQLNALSVIINSLYCSDGHMFTPCEQV